MTTIAPAHLEGVGSIEGVQKAKGELVEAIPPEGIVVLNADEPLVLALAARARRAVMTYGQADEADVRLGDVALADGGLAFRPDRRAARRRTSASRWPAGTTRGTRRRRRPSGSRWESRSTRPRRRWRWRHR